MTVEREPVKVEDIAMHCAWFDGGQVRPDQFPRNTLDKVKR
jgi:uncharacterized protein YodC (DUF2158 family)